MTRATVAGQCRRAACYVAPLGYSMETLCLLWHDLCRVYTVMEQAKQEMVNHNLRLVISVVYKFRYTGMSLSDLIQDGNIGLMRAVDNFDYRRDLKFSTYAIWWIRQAIHRAGSSQSLMRLPNTAATTCDASTRLLTPSWWSMAGPRHPRKLRSAPIFSLERRMEPGAYSRANLHRQLHYPGKQWPLRELLPDTRLTSSHEVLVQHALQRYTQDALACLTPREAIVISRRFGLGDRPVDVGTDRPCFEYLP